MSYFPLKKMPLHHRSHQKHLSTYWQCLYCITDICFWRRRSELIQTPKSLL